MLRRESPRSYWRKKKRSMRLRRMKRIRRMKLRRKLRRIRRMKLRRKLRRIRRMKLRTKKKTRRMKLRRNKNRRNDLYKYINVKGNIYLFYDSNHTVVPNLTTKTSKGSSMYFNMALSIASLIHFMLFPKAPLPSYVNRTLTLLPRFTAIIAAADNVAS